MPSTVGVAVADGVGVFVSVADAVAVGGTGVCVGGSVAVSVGTLTVGVFVAGTFVLVSVGKMSVFVTGTDAPEYNQSENANTRPPLVGDLVGKFSPQNLFAINAT